MEYEKIIKYLQGQASDEEKKQLFNWIEDKPANKEEFISLKKAWALTSQAKEDSDLTWEKNILPKIKSGNKRKLIIGLLQKAAILIMVFALGGAVNYIINQGILDKTVYSNNCVVKVPLGQTSNIELPDGTVVVLNSGSSISYNNNFSSGKREVFLNGEAFFDVMKDKKHPFVLKSKFLDIKVHGTSFNVEAYPEDKSFSTTLVEGSISIIDKEGEELCLLKEGENAKLAANNSELIISEVDTELYTSWTEGIVTFRNERLEDIAKKIERWYNVEIRFHNYNLKDERYLGTILKNKPIDQILEIFKLTCSLQYEIIPRAGEPTLIYWK